MGLKMSNLQPKDPNGNEMKGIEPGWPWQGTRPTLHQDCREISVCWCQGAMGIYLQWMINENILTTLVVIEVVEGDMLCIILGDSFLL